MMNLCNHFRRDTETCKLDGNACPYDEDWKECPKLNRKKSNIRVKGISDAGLARVSRRVAQEDPIEQEVEEPDEQEVWDEKSEEIYTAFMNYEDDLDGSISDASYAMTGPVEDVVAGWNKELNEDIERAFHNRFDRAWDNVVIELSNAGIEMTPEAEERVQELKNEYFVNMRYAFTLFKREFLSSKEYQGFALDLSNAVTKVLIGEDPYQKNRSKKW